VIHVRWDIALRDLDYALGLDTDGDGTITWGELRAQGSEVTSYAFARLTLRGEGEAVCSGELDPRGLAVASHSDGMYAVLRFDARCASAVSSAAIDYRLFFDIDPQHRSIVRIDANGTSRTHTLTKSEHEARFTFADAGHLRQLGSIVKLGILHIWAGYDHILFLLALLLPSVLVRDENGWRAVDRLRPALLDVLRIVTAFTLAHSITLSLAALELVTLPSRLVESVIAASEPHLPARAHRSGSARRRAREACPRHGDRSRARRAHAPRWPRAVGDHHAAARALGVHAGACVARGSGERARVARRGAPQR
jgi:hypothetical protein